MQKKVGKFLIWLSFLLLIFGSRNFIYEVIKDNIVFNKTITFDSKNDYYLTYNYAYVKNQEEFELKNKNDILNVYYTIINSGVDKFEFYCPKEYLNCTEDIRDITENQDYLSDINGFVHPFNSFDTIETTFDTLDRVYVSIVKTYTDKEIVEINEKVDTIIKDVVKEEKDNKKIIELIHDYVINNTKYDKDRADNNIIKYASNTAYGVLFEGYGICSGYADTMSIFLNKYNIPNYKIASENHVWNVVKLDDNWYHLDLTWDDPLTDNGDDVILHDYFLITTDKLKTLDRTQHTYNDSIYREVQTEKELKDKELENNVDGNVNEA